MFSKKELLEKLRSDELFLGALGLVSDSDEKQKITRVVESFLSSFVDSLTPIVKDGKVNVAVDENVRLVNDRDGSIVSGSNV